MTIVSEIELERIRKLMRKAGLGEIKNGINPVTGGLMHKMYRVETTEGIFAVKHLNPEIMKRPSAKDNFTRAESLEKILEENILPIVPAMTINGTKMQAIDGHYYYIYHWLEGQITDWNTISEKQCYLAGQILGRMHAIDAQNVQKEKPSFMPVDFSSFLDLAGDLKLELKEMLSHHLDELSSVQTSILTAGRELPSMRVISDGDMDPKNVMWQGTTPFVIDLECLDYANPMRSMLELGIQWAGAVTYDFSKEKLLAFFKGYLEKYDNGYRSYEDLYGFVYQNWIEWLEYNLGRAAGKEVSSEEEKQLGESESEKTLKLIHYLSEIEPQVREMLANDLPPVCAQNFDTHDQRLCYFEIMFEGSLEHIPDYPLPEGYRIRAVTVDEAPEKVKQDWIEIEKSAREFETYEQGEEAWNRYYGSRTEMLPGRMFFVEDATGQRVATATAFFDIYGRDQSGAGWLHWVAVRREEQGKGLSKPLIAAVLKRLKELGHFQVKIPTQTTTWLACKVYYDMGFRPIPKNLVNSRAGWKMLEQLAGIRVL